MAEIIEHDCTCVGVLDGKSEYRFEVLRDPASIQIGYDYRFSDKNTAQFGMVGI